MNQPPRIGTNYYVCTKCESACDTELIETFQSSAHASGFMRRKQRRSLCCQAPVRITTAKD